MFLLSRMLRVVEVEAAAEGGGSKREKWPEEDEVDGTEAEPYRVFLSNPEYPMPKRLSLGLEAKAGTSSGAKRKSLYLDANSSSPSLPSPSSSSSVPSL